MLRLIYFFRPLRYLQPGSGSLLIQLIVAAMGGGLFFLIKSKWNAWFKKGKTKQHSLDDVEEINADEKNSSTPTTKDERNSLMKGNPMKKSQRISTVSKNKKITSKKIK